MLITAPDTEHCYGLFANSIGSRDTGMFSALLSIDSYSADLPALCSHDIFEFFFFLTFFQLIFCANTSEQNRLSAYVFYYLHFQAHERHTKHYLVMKISYFGWWGELLVGLGR